MFRSDELARAHWEDEMVKLYDGRDLYHGDALYLKTPGFIEMDQIGELQCFPHALYYTYFHDDKEEMDFVVQLIRDEIAVPVLDKKDHQQEQGFVREEISRRLYHRSCGSRSYIY